MSPLFYCLVFQVILWTFIRTVACTTLNKETTTLTIDQGTLVGKKSLDYWNGTFYSFEGIPFAKPPVGELRFKPPEPAEKWSGIYDATKLRPACPQFDPVDNVEQSEDCLFLNVHSKMSKQLRPVMVWVFGGGLQCGSIFERYYGPELLLTEDIVLVKVSHRLNIFGFLRIDDPKYGIHGNMGFKDLVLALKWVQNNIHHFGGDPNSVTIFGESSGGCSVNLLCLSPLAKGLFHRAIVQSGSAGAFWLTTPKKFTDIVPSINCTSNNLDAIVKCINQSSTENLINGLKALDEKPFYNAILNITETFAFSTLSIEENLQGNFLSEKPEIIAKRGHINAVPMIMGFNTHESAGAERNYYFPPNFTDYRVLIPSDIQIDLTSDEAFELGNRIKEVYYGNQTPSHDLIDPFIDYLTDFMVLEKMHKYAKLLSKKTPVYFYEFNYYTKLDPPQNTTKKYIKHFADIAYLFNSKGVTPENLDTNSEEYIAIHRMIKLWTTFAKTGDPNPVNDPLLPIKWLSIEPNTFNYLKISQNLEFKPNIANRPMKFWEEVYQKYNSI